MPAVQGMVLLASALQPRTTREFTALLVLLSGHWPPRGLVSGCWPPDTHLGDGAGAQPAAELEEASADTLADTRDPGAESIMPGANEGSTGRAGREAMPMPMRKPG